MKEAKRDASAAAKRVEADALLAKGLPMSGLDRQALLRMVHKMMDDDDTGHIEAQELHRLGQARRTLGHKSGTWTKENNDKLMSKLDVSGDGNVEAKEFAVYFDKVLPLSPEEFLKIIQQFMDVANHCAIPKTNSPKNTGQQSKKVDEPASSPKTKTLGLTKLPKSTGQRMAILRAVHQAMDDDETGYIEAPELMLLGQARRKLGHKSGEWTEVMNRNLMDRLDKTGDGKVESKEFAEYFDRVLPVEPEDFMKNVDQFMAVANHCNTVEVSGAEAENAAEQAAEEEPAAEEPADSSSSEENWRIMKLLEVFAVFDMDSSGTIEVAELNELGKMRQELGQKSRNWTEERNSKLLSQMDVDDDGMLNGDEFARHFDRKLPDDKQEFLQIIADFMEVAEHCRAFKIKSPAAAPPPAAEEPAAPPAAAAADCSPNSPKLKTLGLTKLPKSTGQRMAILRAVHQAMDDDETGYIEAPELMLLGQARKKTGKKNGEWTEVMNRNLMDRLDKTGDGKVNDKEFAQYFERVLPEDPADFMKTIDQFMAVANLCAAMSPTTHSSESSLTSAGSEQPTEGKDDSDEWVEVAVGDAEGAEDPAAATEATSSAPLSCYVPTGIEEAKLQARLDRLARRKSQSQERRTSLSQEPKSGNTTAEVKVTPASTMDSDKEARRQARLQKQREEEAALEAHMQRMDRLNSKSRSPKKLKTQTAAELERLRTQVQKANKQDAAAADQANTSSQESEALPAGFTSFDNLSSERQDMLRAVHKAMDDDNSGFIEAAELMELGQARRKLGHKSGEWTEEQNQRLVDKMDVNGDGHVHANEFCKYFDRILPGDCAEFIQNVKQFMDVAAHCANDQTNSSIQEGYSAATSDTAAKPKAERKPPKIDVNKPKDPFEQRLNSLASLSPTSPGTPSKKAPKYNASRLDLLSAPSTPTKQSSSQLSSQPGTPRSPTEVSAGVLEARLAAYEKASQSQPKSPQSPTEAKSPRLQNAMRKTEPTAQEKAMEGMHI